MNLLELFGFDFLLLSFPILIYLFYVAFNRSLGTEENELLLDLSILTSFFLLLRYGKEVGKIMYFIPLFYAFQKERKFSFYAGIMFYFLYDSNSYIELFGYLFLSIFLKKREYFILWKLFLIGFSISSILFFIFFFLSLYFFQKGEEILKFSMNVKELEQETQIQESLFKITHEIKNPIAVCKGYLDMFDVNNLEHSKKYVPILKEEMDRTLILLQDFLSMTRIQMEEEELDINLLLEEVSNHFKPLLYQKHIQLKNYLLDDEIYVLGDYNRLLQVFINLIKNGIEAMKEEGTLTIESRVDKDFIIIKVMDTGTGIEENVLKKMKEPFFTTKVNGTGLGVSLSNEIIKKHHGYLNYESDENGTKAIVTLPLSFKMC